MQKLVERTVYVFVGIFALTAMLSLAGIGYLWFGDSRNSLPYLGWLVATLIAEVVGVVVLVAKRALAYLPQTVTNKTHEETIRFMRDFVSMGSTVTIVSNRAGWLAEAPDLLALFGERVKGGGRFELITAHEVSPPLRDKLAQAGVTLYVTNDQQAPEARFTLVNADRSGAERLAIARGTHPDHEILTFDSVSGPQIIGLAKDIIRKSKGSPRV